MLLQQQKTAFGGSKGLLRAAVAVISAIAITDTAFTSYVWLNNGFKDVWRGCDDVGAVKQVQGALLEGAVVAGAPTGDDKVWDCEEDDFDEFKSDSLVMLARR